MVDDHVIKLALAYLDDQLAKGETADLPGMLNYVDYFNRVVMVIGEVNETLKHRPSVYVQRVDGRVVFNQLSGDREITDEDLNRNFQMYHDAFWAEYRKLENRDS